jgi:hypothetical protein
LRWPAPIRIRTVVVHGPRHDGGRMRGTLVLWRDGRELARIAAPTFGTAPARVAAGDRVCDRADLIVQPVGADAAGRRRAAVAEIEVIARLAAP